MGDFDIELTNDPALALSRAHDLLARDPVQHNLILTLLETRVATPQPGRYWIVSDGSGAAGVAFQSPLDFSATVTPMSPGLVDALVDSIFASGLRLPGVIGDAATAASFAGQWAERAKVPAWPVQGQRIYEVDRVIPPRPVEGELRQAIPDDMELVVAWYREFEQEVALGVTTSEEVIERRLGHGHLWIWQHDRPVSFAGVSQPTAGAARIGPVYTPEGLRNRGYASALVSGVSSWVRDSGVRCILYTDLANPTSNSIYRSLGYNAVAEVLRYRF